MAIQPAYTEFTFSTTIKFDRTIIRNTLAQVRDQLLNHDINGGPRKLDMARIVNTCGTAACIGGWASIFLLGFEGASFSRGESDTVHSLFVSLGATYPRLYKLFYGFNYTQHYDEPNVAATAIQRYLDGKNPWPKGKMPNVLRYKRKR